MYTWVLPPSTSARATLCVVSPNTASVNSAVSCAEVPEAGGCAAPVYRSISVSTLAAASAVMAAASSPSRLRGPHVAQSSRNLGPNIVKMCRHSYI